MFKQLKRQLQKIPFTRCILCDVQHAHKNTLLCPSCNKNLPYFSNAYHCNLKQPTLFKSIDTTFSLFHYQPPIDYFIKQLKFQQQVLYAKLLGDKMADALSTYLNSKPDVIFPVPLHIKRLRSRGFNQALEIAKPIAKKLNIPLISDALIRSRYTQAQTELNADQRRSNLNNSFHYAPTSTYKHIALVDDVMTTGATLDEISKTLKQHSSVENISVWVCARAKAT